MHEKGLGQERADPSAGNLDAMRRVQDVAVCEQLEGFDSDAQGEGAGETDADLIARGGARVPPSSGEVVRCRLEMLVVQAPEPVH